MDMIVSVLPKRPGMSKKEILDSMTHLHLQDKKLYNLNVPAGKEAYSTADQDQPILKIFTPNLQTLYLQNNLLT